MRLILGLAAAACALGGCATYDDYDGDGYGYGRYRYDGSAWADRGGRGGGSGAGLLDPWLAETEEGREIVATLWPRTRRGRIDARTAEEANVWFRRHADADRDLCLTDVEIRSALAQLPRHLAMRR